ncbi:glycosyltransferase family 2 protein [Rhodonellum sp.]|uniref:glycosyltransferase family 2 protein n=1 Tax=Rhodonellum sp. TaxID=2231180 RepID=UPI00271E37CA|nr:glycosyltransferase [Rhodonellum sp.]MDO9552694.1 glycosyltransferase [Rhodonellum sp.]
MQKIDVIILSNASSPELKGITENAVQSLIASENPSDIQFDIVVIESNKKQEEYAYPCTRTLFPRKKFGFHKYFNLGISKTDSQYICLANNDLVFHKSWASEMLRAFDADPSLVSASPACSIHHPAHGVDLYSGIHEGLEVRKEVAGWCLFFKREMLDITGKLDEGFTFWYSDNDYINTIQKHGLKHALVSSSIVDHLESQTLKSKDEKEQFKLTHNDRFYYEYKWGKRSLFSYLNIKRKLFFR